MAAAASRASGAGTPRWRRPFRSRRAPAVRRRAAGQLDRPGQVAGHQQHRDGPEPRRDRGPRVDSHSTGLRFRSACVHCSYAEGRQQPSACGRVESPRVEGSSAAGPGDLCPTARCFPLRCPEQARTKAIQALGEGARDASLSGAGRHDRRCHDGHPGHAPQGRGRHPGQGADRRRTGAHPAGPGGQRRRQGRPVRKERLQRDPEGPALDAPAVPGPPGHRHGPRPRESSWTATRRRCRPTRAWRRRPG